MAGVRVRMKFELTLISILSHAMIWYSVVIGCIINLHFESCILDLETITESVPECDAETLIITVRICPAAGAMLRR